MSMPEELYDLDNAAKNLFRRATEITTMTQYYGLLTLFAAAKHAKATGDAELLSKCKSYFDLYPDKVQHPSYSFEFNRIGSIGKAFLTMKGEYDNYDEIREYAEITLNRDRTDDGIICHLNQSLGKWIWVDLIAYVAPFMVYAGVALNEPKYYTYAAEQAIRIYDALVDEEYGLVHQSRGVFGPDEPYRKTEDHWSRGNGWMMVGFAELVEYLPKTCPLYDEVLKRYRRFCHGLIGTQSPRGLWRQDITHPEAWEESSGTGLLAYGLGVGMRLGILTDSVYLDMFKNAIWGLANHCVTDEFNTYHCCESCQCPQHLGEWGTVDSYIVGTRSFRNEQHSFGPIILAFSEAMANGMPTTMRMGSANYAKSL